MIDHLGHWTSINAKDSMVKKKKKRRRRDYMVSSAVGSFWKDINLLMSDFGCLYSFIKCKLFKQ